MAGFGFRTSGLMPMTSDMIPSNTPGIQLPYDPGPLSRSNPIQPQQQGGFFGKAMDRMGGTAGLLQALSAATGDLGHPGQNRLAGLMQDRQLQQQQQAEEEKKQANAQRLQEAFAALQANPNATRDDWGKALAPFFANQNNPSAMMGFAPPVPEKPTRFTTPEGIVEANGGDYKLAFPFPKKPSTSPGGVNPETGQWEWAPNYLDSLAQRTSATTTASRQAQIKTPLPQRGRAGGGGGSRKASGSGPKLPAGFILD